MTVYNNVEILVCVLDRETKKAIEIEIER